MRCLIDASTDPYWNLAAEEYLLTQSAQSVCRLWRNNPSIIVGRNQNTAAEVDTAYVEAHRLPVVRRLSGGGAVFHDLGNLNFSFFDTRTSPQLDTTALFARYTRPILDFLETCGVHAVLEGRNDLLINGLKCSGNAIAVYKDRVLMHGTLLYSASMQDLSRALVAKVRDAFAGNAVASRRARVGNVQDFMPHPLSMDAFKDALGAFLANALCDGIQSHWTPEEIAGVQQLCDSKYATYAWNYGHSPAYNFHRKERFPQGNVEVYLRIEKGLIHEAHIYGDYFAAAPAEELALALKDCPHNAEALRGRLSALTLADYLPLSLADFITLLV